MKQKYYIQKHKLNYTNKEEAFNALFGRVGRATSPDVIVQLFKAKCLPALYCGYEICPVNKTVTKS